MIKSGFRYLKLTAVVAVLALALIPSVRPSTATNQPTPVATAAPGADIANEERALAKYFDDLVAYRQQTAQLSAKAKLVSTDLDAVQRRSEDLKGRLSGLQSTIGEIVKKLKAAKEWDNLDTNVAAGITDPSQKSFFEQNSFKQLLEESSNNLSSHKNEISTPLDNLRKRLASRTFSFGDDADVQIVRASYEAPAPVMAFVSLACSVGKVRLGLIHRLGGIATNGTIDQVSCACNPGIGIGLGTGASCASLN
jgi:hypothetical protein